jgi:hypothetical protein
MLFKRRCWMRPAAALAIVMISLTGCARVGSDAPASVCPPVAEYSRAEQVRVAEEIAALPEGARIPDWLADYAVLRDQARACAGR